MAACEESRKTDDECLCHSRDLQVDRDLARTASLQHQRPPALARQQVIHATQPPKGPPKTPAKPTLGASPPAHSSGRREAALPGLPKAALWDAVSLRATLTARVLHGIWRGYLSKNFTLCRNLRRKKIKSQIKSCPYIKGMKNAVQNNNCSRYLRLVFST